MINSDLPQPQRSSFFWLAKQGNHRKLQESFRVSQSIDYLRLGVKYLIFDLRPRGGKISSCGRN